MKGNIDMTKRAAIFSLFLLIIYQATHAQAETITLRVALYPHVPNQTWTSHVITQRWAEQHPDVKLEFVWTWDRWDGGYDSQPSKEFDVVGLDTLYLRDFVGDGLLSAVPVPKGKDFFPFALEACKIGQEFYGVPYLTCQPVLFTREGDTDLKEAKTVSEIYKILGSFDDWLLKPYGDERGLLSTEFSSGTATVCLLIDAIAELNPGSKVLSVPDPSQIDTTALNLVIKLKETAGNRQAAWDNYSNARARWYADGYGRALFGYTERLAKMPANTQKRLNVQPISFTQRTHDLFYVDALAVPSGLSKERKQLAIELIGVITASETIAEIMVPRGDVPQYLLPARQEALDKIKLDQFAPFYKELAPLLESKRPKGGFVLVVGSRAKMEKVKDTIQERILDGTLK
jgi:thiamine pyridinylase